MTPIRPHRLLEHLVLGLFLFVAGLSGQAGGLWGAEEPDLAAVEVDYEPERGPEPEDDHDDDDDAMARGKAADADPGVRAAPWLTNRFAHPSAALDRIFRPPIA